MTLSFMIAITITMLVCYTIVAATVQMITRRGKVFQVVRNLTSR